jgi:hypothetical protein
MRIDVNSGTISLKGTPRHHRATPKKQSTQRNQSKSAKKKSLENNTSRSRSSSRNLAKSCSMPSIRARNRTLNQESSKKYKNTPSSNKVTKEREISSHCKGCNDFSYHDQKQPISRNRPLSRILSASQLKKSLNSL